MTTTEAQRIATWANSHDDGTPQPRATVETTGSTVTIQLRSSERTSDGAWSVVAEHMRSLSDVRDALGY